ncbi:hypothetical protein RJ639_046516 [Escallonia herrerae]|uniref:Bet v I/Major latex protein domain-containing protein n=1 Tax=Escallonia herrerae TaxID=1293975 RepID=A0AA88W5N1_9ASTE|nr:hypothetical protein RJ639_046516 [Escallonia herrerae]
MDQHSTVNKSLKYSTIMAPHKHKPSHVQETQTSRFSVTEAEPAAGTPEFTSYKEKFTIVDHVKKMKETEIIEGGYLDLGFNLHRVRFEIIEKSAHSCITRATIEYDTKEESATNASFVSIELLLDIMKIAADNLLKNDNTQISFFVNFPVRHCCINNSTAL